jgi:glycerol-3-phosphate acyltransferase PlsY
MGARKVSRTLGWKPATVVAFVDFFKGTVPVLLAQQAGLVPAWQVAAARAAALGHDLPVFAGFRGGQGLGTILGAFLALALDALAFAPARLSDASARLGIVVIFVLMWRGGQPAVVLLGALGMILAVPVKMLLDHPRRALLNQAGQGQPLP